MIVPYEIAVKLKQLGFSKPTFDYYRLHEDGNVSKFSTSYSGAQNWNEQQRKVYSAPTVSDALQDIRERYKMPLAVVFEWQPDFHENYHYENFTYHGEFGIKNAKGQSDYKYTGIFDTHPEAESALLDELLTYIEQKR